MAEDHINKYHRIAIEQLKRCDELLEECALILDSLELYFETTPKPSVLLGWGY
ncbi:MAG TPA: hypothetical protein VJ377_04070 [Dehalococcoidales bacterium]|nr:hypothetical protein [Dehalococcoidales bacterium]